MSMMFVSVEGAKVVAASIIGIDPERFEEDPGLRVLGVLEAALLDDPRTPEEAKQDIRNKVDSQKGFKVVKDGKEIKIVIGRFRSGFDCYFIDENGFSMRL